MKIVTSFLNLATLSSSGADSGFPVSNIADLDPGKIWKSSAYAGDVWVQNQFGAATSFTAVFLNRCNFPQCKIQTSSDGVSFFDIATVSLVADDAGNRKAFVVLNHSAVYVRVLIPGGQTLDTGSVPVIGNLILGVSVELPVQRFSARLQQRFYRFENDSGSISKNRKGRSRHIISITVESTLEAIRGINKTWDMAVLFADMGNLGEAWLVFAPDDWEKPIRYALDSSLGFMMEERP